MYPGDDRVAQRVLDARLTANLQNLDVILTVNNLFNHNYTQRERILEPIRHVVLTLHGHF